MSPKQASCECHIVKRQIVFCSLHKLSSIMRKTLEKLLHYQKNTLDRLLKFHGLTEINVDVEFEFRRVIARGEALIVRSYKTRRK